MKWLCSFFPPGSPPGSARTVCEQSRMTWSPDEKSLKQMLHVPFASPRTIALNSTSTHCLSVSFFGGGGASPRICASVGRSAYSPSAGGCC